MDYQNLVIKASCGSEDHNDDSPTSPKSSSDLFSRSNERNKVKDRKTSFTFISDLEGIVTTMIRIMYIKFENQISGFRTPLKHVICIPRRLSIFHYPTVQFNLDRSSDFGYNRVNPVASNGRWNISLNSLYEFGISYQSDFLFEKGTTSIDTSCIIPASVLDQGWEYGSTRMRDVAMNDLPFNIVDKLDFKPIDIQDILDFLSSSNNIITYYPNGNFNYSRVRTICSGLEKFGKPQQEKYTSNMLDDYKNISIYRYKRKMGPTQIRNGREDTLNRYVEMETAYNSLLWDQSQEFMPFFDIKIDLSDFPMQPIEIHLVSGSLLDDFEKQITMTKGHWIHRVIICSCLTHMTVTDEHSLFCKKITIFKELA